MNTDPAIAADHLVTVPPGRPKTIEVPLPLLLIPVKRLQGFDEALHAEPGRVLPVIHARADDRVAVKADGLHGFDPMG